MNNFARTKYITPNDDGIIGESDSASIQNAVDKAHSAGTNAVLIPRYNKRRQNFLWEIEETVLLPSSMTVILDNCHMRQADGVMTNMFRNSNMYAEDSCTKEGEQHDIVIRGMGNAVLDGGRHNGLLELNSGKHGLPHVRFNNIILLHNVRNFTVENLKIINPRWWAINIMSSCEGCISNIDFYAANNVPNQDGINLRAGCNNIRIENITGQSGDDLIALTALANCSTPLLVGKDMDIHDIVIRNVMGTSVRQGLVTLRNQNDSRLYNVLIENVFDTGNGDERNMPYGVIRIGENLYIKNKPSEIGSTFGITVCNVASRYKDTIVLGATLADSEFKNIHVRGFARRAFATDTRPYFTWDGEGGVKLRNVTIDGVYFSSEVIESCIFDFGNMRSEDYAENLKVKNVFAENAKHIAHFNGNMHVDAENICVKRSFGEAYICENGAKVTVNGGGIEMEANEL